MRNSKFGANSGQIGHLPQIRSIAPIFRTTKGSGTKNVHLFKKFKRMFFALENKIAMVEVRISELKYVIADD